MRRAPFRSLIAAAAAAALLAGLAACGKKGSLQPPEERAEEYTYPRVYPAPETVLPEGGAETAEDEEGAGTREGGMQ